MRKVNKKIVEPTGNCAPFPRDWVSESHPVRSKWIRSGGFRRMTLNPEQVVPHPTPAEAKEWRKKGANRTLDRPAGPYRRSMPHS